MPVPQVVVEYEATELRPASGAAPEAVAEESIAAVGRAVNDLRHSFTQLGTVVANTNATWNMWVTSATTISASNNTTWTSWSGGTGSISYNLNYAPPPLSEEEVERQREARVERERRHQERVAADTARREAARTRAEGLLRTVLNEQQWDSYRRERHFELITQSGRRYRIRRGVSHNVELIENDEALESYCAHPNTAVYADDQEFLGHMPAEDVVVAQVLALRTDEEGFRRTANISRHWRDRDRLAA